MSAVTIRRSSTWYRVATERRNAVTSIRGPTRIWAFGGSDAPAEDVAAETTNATVRTATTRHARRTLISRMIAQRGLHQLADRPEIEIQIIWRQAEARADVLYGFFKPHQRDADLFDFLRRERLRVHAANCLALHQLSQELHDRQNELCHR